MGRARQSRALMSDDTRPLSFSQECPAISAGREHKDLGHGLIFMAAEMCGQK